MIKEKKHRLPIELYKGKINVSFTLCIKDKQSILNNKEVVNVFIEILSKVIKKYDCIIPVFCFMPDHLHLIISGINDNSDIWKAVVDFKHVQ